MNSTIEIMKMNGTIKKINSLRSTYNNMTDDEIKSKALELRKKYTDADAKKILPDAFALVREASRRAIGKEHYDVQLMAGIALFDGRIAEAKTGEGKTITIYLPAFLASLSGRGVHVVTVNDYLANRDATEARLVFERLGISVGCVLHSSTIDDRKEAYACDITYVTNSELGFDYLKDNITTRVEDQVLKRGFEYAIIDEVDSVLIDEAKTPLIISGPGPDSSDLLLTVDTFVKTLTEGTVTEVSAAEKLMGVVSSESGDYIKNEKDSMVYLTEKGLDKLSEYFNIDSYGSASTVTLQRALNNALRANYMMRKDIDYIVRDGAVEIIDSFTGRVLPGRRFSNGLHQAIEAKEKVEIKKENVTVATITFQSFFNKYHKKAGLTGTAITSAKEFKEVYHLDVVVIPTNKPIARKDFEDAVFRTKKEKWQAVIEEVEATHSTGQPILVGTASIEDSEIVSELLQRRGIEHNVLNAKNEAIEAEIIAMAGQLNAVTVATNMAGRGTDIILDEESKNLGGLKVIGTERHESRRIDNQLKGRSGRQGDPGTSQFFISLDDRIMRVFGEKSSMEMLMMMATEPGQPLQYKPLTRIVEKAQEAVETSNRLIRENMMKYDDANNEHREQIYMQRQDILTCDDPTQILKDMFYEVSDEIVEKYIQSDDQSTWQTTEMFNAYFDAFQFVSINLDLNHMTKSDLKVAIRQLDDFLIHMKTRDIPDQNIVKELQRNVILRFVDRNWASFLNSMEFIKQNIGSQAYAQRDPSIEYKKKGVEIFNVMVENIQKDVVKNFLACRIAFTPPETPAEESEEEKN